MEMVKGKASYPFARALLALDLNSAS